ncbi:MAG: site-2 protease family protein, partial [Patescibacteria group bacterium]
VILNLSLAIFNLVPIPPLDGSKILFQLLPKSFSNLEKLMEDYALIFILIFIIYFSQYLSPIIFYLNKIIIGF